MKDFLKIPGSRKGRVKLSEIKEDFFVREETNQSHVNFLRQLYVESKSSGKNVLPPIILTEDKTLVDGRHRKTMYKLEKEKEVDCIFIPDMPRHELIMLALAANVGGALTPTDRDISHTVRMLLEDKVDRKTIIEKLCTLTQFPKDMVVKYLDRVQSDMVKARTRLAARDVIDGKSTPQEAADKYGVGLNMVKRELGAGRRVNKKNTVGHFNSLIGSRSRSGNTSMSKVLKRTLSGFIDGTMTAEEVQKVFDATEEAVTKTCTIIEVWRERQRVIFDKVHKGRNSEAEAILNEPTPQGNPHDPSNKEAHKRATSLGETALKKITGKA